MIEFTMPQLLRMKELYVEQNKGCGPIGKIFGLDKDGVLRRLRDMGVEIRGRGVPLTVTLDNMAEVSQMRASGARWCDILSIHGGTDMNRRKHIRKLDHMGYYNEEKTLYFAGTERGLHVAPDEARRSTDLHRITTEQVREGLLVAQPGDYKGHIWYRLTKAGEIRLLELQIQWRLERDKDTTEHEAKLAALKAE